MKRLHKTLLTCSDPESRRMLEPMLAACGLKTVVAGSVEESRRVLRSGGVEMVFCAAELGDGGFREVLREAAASARAVPVVVVSSRADTREYLETMRAGAFDYVAVPCERREVEYIVRNALRAESAKAAAG